MVCMCAEPGTWYAAQLQSSAYSSIRTTDHRYSFFIFVPSIPLIIFALLFSLPLTSTVVAIEIRGHIAGLFPLPATVRALDQIEFQLFLPSSTRVELCLPTTFPRKTHTQLEKTRLKLRRNLRRNLPRKNSRKTYNSYTTVPGMNKNKSHITAHPKSSQAHHTGNTYTRFLPFGRGARGDARLMVFNLFTHQWKARRIYSQGMEVRLVGNM